MRRTDPDGDVPVPPTDPKAPGLPGEPHDTTATPPAAYDRAFSVVAFAMNRFIVDHVLRAARMFDGDVETMILFGVVSHLNVAHLILPGARPSESLDEAGKLPGDAQPALRPVRLRDLVIVTGKPRETIRRRLERLRACGHLLKRDDGWVLDLASIDGSLRDATLDGLTRFRRTAAVIDAALADAERALGGSTDRPALRTDLAAARRAAR
jgi:hypothetical protein